MKCPICGGELTPLDEKFVVCSTCGAKIPADRVAPPATETPVSAPVEPPLDKTEDQKRLAELERRLAEMEEEKKQKEASAFGTKCKAAFSKVGNWVKGHKKATAFSVLGLLVVITVIVLCVSLCGLRGIYVNENNPYEYYEFGVSSYKCTMPLLGTEVTEEGSYKLSGDKIIFTVEDELLGTVSADDDFKKVDGYSKVAIGMNNYYFVGYCLNSKIKITFEANGGEGTEKIKIKRKDTINEVPTVTKVGYLFVTWEDSDGNAFPLGCPLWTDKTYYAKWKECDHAEMTCKDKSCPTCKMLKSNLSKRAAKALSHASLDKHCYCSICEETAHSYDAQGACLRCKAGNVKMSEDTVLGLGDFSGTELVIPYGAKEISSTAFKNKSSLISVTIPDTVTHIGEEAFSGCSNLRSVIVGDGVVSILKKAFYKCERLTSVTIGSSVSLIEKEAFSDCYRLAQIYNKSSLNIKRQSSYNGDIGENALNIYTPRSGWNKLQTTDDGYVICASGESEQTRYYLIDYYGKETALTLPDYNIGQYAFYNHTKITSVTIPSGVRSIGSGAFSGCYRLTSIYYSGDMRGWCGIFGLEGLMLYGGASSKTLYIGGTKVEGDLVLSDIYGGISNSAFSSLTDLTSVTIGSGVTSIGDRAFEYCRKITSLTIPNSVTSIGDYAFAECTNLTSVTIGSGVTSIGTAAFGSCFKLVEVCNKSSLNIEAGSSANGMVGYYAKAVYVGDYVSKISMDEEGFVIYADGENRSLLAYNGDEEELTIPEGVTEINSSAFYASDIISITISNDVTSIGAFAFYESKGLTSVTIPDSVTSIGESAFYRCTGLTSVTIGSGVTSIGQYAFSGCTSLTYNNFDNAKYLGNQSNPFVVLIKSNDRNITSCELSSNLKIIYEEAFYECSNLTSVTIPDSVTSIGGYAFYKCSGLSSITIPDSVISIGPYAFNGCTAEIVWDGVPTITTIDKNVFNGYIGSTLLIPDSVTNIGEEAFSGCSANIVWGDAPSIASIGSAAFRAYKGTNVTIPDSVTSIGDYAFYGCSGLTSITIPYSVTSIGNYAFYRCSGMTSVMIGIGVTNIGQYAFYECSGMTSVTIPDSVTSIGQYAFSGCTSLTYNNFDNAKYLGNQSNPFVVLKEANDRNITSCELSSNLKIIYEHAFRECSNLTSITIPDSVTSIGNYAFEYCTGLTTVTIGSGVTSIGREAFRGCTGLTSVTIPDSVTSIGQSAFEYCTGLTSVTIGSGVTSIGREVFRDCTGLTSVTIPDSVTSIGQFAFEHCTSLTSINYQGTKAQWNAITKESSWNDLTDNYTIHCTDGDIAW